MVEGVSGKTGSAEDEVRRPAICMCDASLRVYRLRREQMNM